MSQTKLSGSEWSCTEKSHYRPGVYLRNKWVSAFRGSVSGEGRTTEPPAAPVADGEGGIDLVSRMIKNKFSRQAIQKKKEASWLTPSLASLSQLVQLEQCLSIVVFQTKK